MPLFVIQLYYLLFGDPIFVRWGSGFGTICCSAALFVIQQPYFFSEGTLFFVQRHFFFSATTTDPSGSPSLLRAAPHQH